MPKLNERGIAHIFIIIILLLGLGLGIYLVTQKTAFFSRASSNPISAPVDDSSTPPTGTLKMTLASASSDGNHVAWATRGAQSAPFQLNKTYKISFWYKASAVSELRMRDNGLVTLNPATNLTYYSTTKTLTQSFDGAPCNNYGGDNMCYLLFHLYGNGNFEVGNLKIEEVDSGSPNMMAYSTYDNSSWYGWSVCLPDWKGTCSVGLTGNPTPTTSNSDKALNMFLVSSSPGGNKIAWANRGAQTIPFQLGRTYTFSFSYQSLSVFELRMRDNGIQAFNPTNGPIEVKTVSFSRTFTQSFDGAPCNNYGGDNQCYLLFYLYGDGRTIIKNLKVTDADSGDNINILTNTTFDGSSWTGWSLCLSDWKGSCSVTNPVVSWGEDSVPTLDPVASYKRVFITSNSYTGNLGGVSGADTKCQQSANTANLGGTWKAWISGNDSQTSPDSRFTKTTGYKSLQNDIIANSWEDLISADPENNYLKTGIDITENKTPNGGWVWSNTQITGQRYGDSGYNCRDWTSSGPDYGFTGGASYKSSFWTFAGPKRCAQEAALYCFEQSPTPTPIPSSGTPYAYPTPSYGTPTYGTPAYGTPSYSTPSSYETPSYNTPPYFTPQ